MQGVRELAGMVLDKQVRLGRPVGFHGLPEATGGPAFSTCAGLLKYAITHAPPSAKGRKANEIEDKPSRFGRLGTWLKNNF